MLESGMKPVYVFDGAPPEAKKEELARRAGQRGDATAELEAAKEAGDAEAIEKFAKRTVKVTRQHNEECKQLLRLLGVPVVDAPSEAEAQCAEMVKAGVVYAAATEDMDVLTFGTPRVVRNLMAPVSANKDPTEYDLSVALRDLGLTQEQFVDVCILCGCDYAGTLKGVGPTRALALIKELGSIEAVLAVKDAEGKPKYPPPEPFPYEAARRLFLQPLVTPAAQLDPPPKWTGPDVDGLVSFLCGEKGFSEDRVRKALTRLDAAKAKATQGRLESFFGPSTTVKSTVGVKRKEEAAVAAAKGKKGGVGKLTAKKGKMGGFGKK
jgi:flap endonuclease-1